MLEPGQLEAPDLGLKVEQSPDFTRLRVPSRLSVIQWLGLALLVAAPLYVWTILAHSFLSGLPGMSGLLMAASLIVILFSAAAVFLFRRLRSGTTVTVSRDRVLIKKAWVTEEPFESLVSEARFEETPDAILVLGGGQKTTIGSILKPAQRSAAVDYLTGLIDERMRAAHARAVDSARGSDVSGDEVLPDNDPQEIRLLALCRGLKANDKGNQVHVAPNIPQPVLVSALQSYLDIQDDEALLLIGGVPKQGGGIVGCAVTSKRVYWPGKRLKSPGSSPPRSQSMDHASLPGIVRRKPGGTALELGDRRRIICAGTGSIGPGLIELLAGTRAIASRDVLAPEISDHDRGNARSTWPRVVAANTEAKALQAAIRKYVSRTQIASHPLVTQLIALACFAVYVAMCATGVSPLAPTSTQLVAWGANYGPAAVIDGQFWRFFTSMFLHIGLFHILMNMFCLATSGPLVERFLGHFGFAALYMLSGIGGSIASLWAHPMYVSAGASGAIFGIFGGLLGFLLLRHRDVPSAVLKPMRVGAIAFVGYNTLFSLSIPGIDMAAHLGGLASGFVCGLLMALVSPVPAHEARRLVPALMRAVVAVIVAAALSVLGWKSVDAARSKILADRVNLIAKQLQPAPKYPSANP